jgi:acetyl-CoA carboxylase biotin carboxyl carrier protein
MDIRKIKKLIDLVKETGVAELEIQEDKERVRITCASTNNTCVSQEALLIPNGKVIQSSASVKESSSTLPAEKAPGHTIKSPMVGTVYLSSSPGTPPFVETGRRIKAGEVVCLIEAMKMFNRIEADKDGVIKTRMVENEQPVEFGQPLFVLEDE